MTAKLSLCWGSMEGIGLVELIKVAANAGFDAITVNSALYQDALAEGLSDIDIAALLADNSVFVSGIDPLFNWLPSSVKLEGDDVMSRLTQASMQDIFDLAHVTGTNLVNAPLGLAVPDSEQQIIDCFATLCERAAAEQLRVSLEFMPFSQVSNLKMAARIVEKANCHNGGLMFDCWHHHRAGGNPADILSVPGKKFFALQLDDALQQPMEDILDETLNHRELPGEGCIDLVQTLRNLNNIGAELVYDVEVFKDSLRGETTAERARQLFESSQKVVEQL
ncbi:MAG: sugar phosphate isomerase/epimerase family protein [Pseudomonadales bacterium]